jgi:hypothetical protein
MQLIQPINDVSIVLRLVVLKRRLAGWLRGGRKTEEDLIRSEGRTEAEAGSDGDH